MNWTGGRLQRHSTAGDNVKIRQKQHFAKVQQSFRNGLKKKLPVKWTIFDQEVMDHRQSQRAGSSSQRGSYSNERSQISRPRHYSSCIVPDYEHKHTSETNESSGSHESFQLKPKSNRVPDDDIYNATPPPPRGTKRAREASMPAPDTESVRERRCQEDSMAEKKRKILRKGDWVGLDIQKPLQIVFAPPDDENVGRRRKIKEGHRARYQDRQSHIISPFGQRRLPLGGFSHEENPQRIPSKSDVRIYIGGKVVPPGFSSSSAYGGRGTQSTGTRRRSPTISSDVMLLDSEDNREHQKHSDKPRRHYSRHHNGEHTEYHHNPQQRYSQPTGLSLSEGYLPSSHQCASQDTDNEWSGFTDSVYLSQENAQEPEGDCDNISHSSGRLPVTKSQSTFDLKKSNRSGQLIYSSSSASIHHPKPQSSKVSSLLRSDSSNIAESTVAQIGKAKPAVPSSQILDNEIWRTWIAPSEEDIDFGQGSGEQFSQDMRQISISPGVSTFERNRTRHAPIELEEDEEPSEDNRFAVIGGAQEQSLKRLPMTQSHARYCKERLFSRLVRPKRQSPEQVQEQRSASGLLQPPHNKSQADPYATLVKSRVPMSKLHTIPNPSNLPVEQKKQEDLDEIWMKFVFGSNSDDDDVKMPQPVTKHHYSVGEQNFPASSVMGHLNASSKSSSTTATHAQSTVVERSHSYTGFNSQRSIECSPHSNSSRHWDARSMEYLHTGDSGTSKHVSEGSQISRSSNIAAASVMAQDSTPSSNSSSATSSQQQKVLFTKPMPFARKKPWKGTKKEQEPLHIGRGLIFEKETRDMGGNEKEERDIYSVVSSDNQDEEDVESIEDD